MVVRLRSVRGWGLIVGTVLGSSMAILDGSVVNVALPHIGAELNASVGGLQWTVNAYLLPLAALVLLGGALGDRYGRRRMFLIGVVWFTVASVACGFAPGIGVLVAARAVQGVGSALLTPGSLALIQSTMDPEDRPAAIGLWAGLGGVASAGAPLIGGYLIDTLSWRWIFFINVPIAVLTVVFTLRYAPESRGTGTSSFDVVGAVLGAFGLGLLTYALVQAELPVGVGGAVLLAGFVWWEHRRAGGAMMPTRLFRSVVFSTINGVTLLVYAALGGLFFFLVLQLQQVAGFSALEAGASAVPMTLLLLVGSERAGELGKRVGARLPLAGGTALCTIGVLLLLRVGAGASYWRDVFGPIVLLGVGMTLVVAPLTATVLAAAPTSLAGVASGINNAVARSGSLLAVAALPLAGGLTGDAYGDPAEVNHAYRLAMAVCAILYAVSVVLSFVLLPRGPIEEPPA